jgi:hypothetical protein
MFLRPACLLYTPNDRTTDRSMRLQPGLCPLLWFCGVCVCVGGFYFSFLFFFLLFPISPFLFLLLLFFSRLFSSASSSFSFFHIFLPILFLPYLVSPFSTLLFLSLFFFYYFSFPPLSTFPLLSSISIIQCNIIPRLLIFLTPQPEPLPSPGEGWETHASRVTCYVLRPLPVFSCLWDLGSFMYLYVYPWRSCL